MRVRIIIRQQSHIELFKASKCKWYDSKHGQFANDREVNEHRFGQIFNSKKKDWHFWISAAIDHNKCVWSIQLGNSFVMCTLQHTFSLWRSETLITTLIYPANYPTFSSINNRPFFVYMLRNPIPCPLAAPTFVRSYNKAPHHQYPHTKQTHRHIDMNRYTQTIILITVKSAKTFFITQAYTEKGWMREKGGQAILNGITGFGLTYYVFVVLREHF